MLKQYKFNRWDYSILKCKGEGLEGYGWKLAIYKNRNRVYAQSGFGAISTAESYFRKYMIEHEFDIELD